MGSRDEIFRVARGGWVGYFWRHRGRPSGIALDDVHLRFEECDGRLEPVELHLPAGEPLTAARLRAVPIGRIAAWANAPKVAVVIREHIDDRVALPGLDDWVTMHGRGLALRPLHVPDAPYGDDFYRQVAAAYSSLASQINRPAAELAEANNRPVTTVHTWIKEARRRGFLPPGHRGKAG